MIRRGHALTGLLDLNDAVLQNIRNYTHTHSITSQKTKSSREAMSVVTNALKLKSKIV
jgi:hypothetical protein